MMFWSFLLAIAWHLSTVYGAQCVLTANDNGETSDARILSGYSTAMGSVLNLSYHDTAQSLGAKYLFPGSMRHPGGAVANYWNFTNASYVYPCNTTHYNYCGRQYKINQLPLQTFSPGNFSNGISSISSINKTINGSHSIVFDMNLLTMSGEDMLNQINTLKSEIPIDKLKYIELGNEYYISSKYNWSLPNSTYYMQKALPLINKIRNDIPSSYIAAVVDRPVTNYSDVEPWNDGIAAYKQYIDAITIHDYSCYFQMHHVDKVAATNQTTYILKYGLSVIPQYISYIQKKFGTDKKIWMTEFNWATDGHFNDSVSFSAIHGIFVMGYIQTAICNYDIWEFLMYYLWNSQVDTSTNQPGYSYPQLLMYNSQYANDINNTYYDIVGQIYAHFSWLSMVKNNRMYCLNVDEECTNIGITIVGNNNLKCVHGSGFSNDNHQNTFGFAVINACLYNVTLVLQLNNIVDLNENVEIEYWIYFASDSFEGNGLEKFVDCENGKQLWECGEFRPKYGDLQVNKNDNFLSVVLEPLSLTLGSTK
eukprot:452300_1